MKAEERRALLGADVVSAVRTEARRAAEEFPPGPEVIEALRPILATRMVWKHRSTRAPIAA